MPGGDEPADASDIMSAHWRVQTYTPKAIQRHQFLQPHTFGPWDEVRTQEGNSHRYEATVQSPGKQSPGCSLPKIVEVLFSEPLHHVAIL